MMPYDLRTLFSKKGRRGHASIGAHISFQNGHQLKGCIATLIYANLCKALCKAEQLREFLRSES